MKKFVIKLVLLFLVVSGIFAQNSAAMANRNTAIRCLKLAENCLIGGDIQNALSEAELGLSYDDGISDLYYVKAAALVNKGISKTKIIETVNLAFEKNDWVDYTKNGARILLADLLCDTGKYYESLNTLDAEPLIYSADAEFIRIKDYYRIGSEEALNQARLKVNSSRRVYSSDLRFPDIFFMFEVLNMERNRILYGEYKVPELVQTIADSYILKLPDYTGEKTELELLATFFADEEVQKRLIKAIDSKNQTKDPLLALCGLNSGLYSDQKAFDLFFEYSGDEISLFYLDVLGSMLTDENVRQQFLEKFVNFEGTLSIDEDFDLQTELKVKYALGRPALIDYDVNNDGEREIYSECDLGTPEYIYFDNDHTELFYDVYPYVSKVVFKDDAYTFGFLYDDFDFSTFDMKTDVVFKNYGLDFYVPVSVNSHYLLSYSNLIGKCSTFELPVTERDNAKIVYKMLNGKAVFADFYEADKLYAYCDFSHGNPFVRYADYDLDNYFETVETFNIAQEFDQKRMADGDVDFITGIFSTAAGEQNVYLEKIQIDRNGNTFCEYVEEFIPGGRISYWDDDDDGIVDCKNTVRSSVDKESILEETIFYDKQGEEKVCVSTLNEIPIKMRYNGKEAIIFAGNNSNIYWIDQNGSEKEEAAVLKTVKNGKLEQGAVDLIQAEHSQIMIIKVGKNYFCTIVSSDASDYYYDAENDVTVINE